MNRSVTDNTRNKGRQTRVWGRLNAQGTLRAHNLGGFFRRPQLSLTLNALIINRDLIFMKILSLLLTILKKIFKWKRYIYSKFFEQLLNTFCKIYFNLNKYFFLFLPSLSKYINAM